MKIKKLIKRLSEDGHMIKIRKGDVKITVYPLFPDKRAAAARPKVKKQPKTVKIDHGKIMALHDAGWSICRISDELGCSIIDVSNHINGTF